MCNLETEGTKYGCGHYKVTKKVRKLDCMSPYCIHSSRHPSYCPDCHCDRFFGPDAKETITLTTKEYCTSCQYWFKGGAQQRR
ncbi:hypothetical protein SERLA73DRAFT_179966 [Serpula lacrymans var. lacrymans S7.3]|uniref:Uncharacterized protein n=2 Tax=Serpula lacrymans var. lacrymans TaxID=341189 RepID=F8PV77_SERL3|nr:uncharacterized protein SERLADRAFT_465347 [Serpula lacrymans var. lacrymans S7.9]EGN99769.1 hypothetical protein SERLA73DRAFT_179966 [Serpula lacrymans var. lacrymans S7.3]EGO25344.1 hypothetical protein SERLADRAFT_465347 [Serpula lacrymans var. lacrymans S7.9]